MVHTYVATYCHIPEEDTPIVIQERASNIEENVFLASSSYYDGFKGIMPKMKFSHFKNTFSRICTPETKKGIFVNPNIRNTVHCATYEITLNPTKQSDWEI
jgi:hypothetical protein